MAGQEGSQQKAVTAEEASSNPTQQTSATDGVRTPERCTTVAQAEAQIEEPVSEPQAEAADQDGYDDDEADCDDYQDDADYDGYDDEAEDDYDYGSEYDSEYEDDDDYDWESEFARHRPVVRETLLSFPEAANLEPQELDAAVERVLEQSKPEYTDVAAPGKIRLFKNDITLILTHDRQPPIIHDLPSTIFPPVDEEAEDRFEELQAKVRKDLLEKGYAEVDEDFYDQRDGFREELQEEWDKIDFSRFRFATSDDGILRYSEELGDFI